MNGKVITNTDAQVLIVNGLTIDIRSYQTNQRHHEIADLVMARFGYDPNNVTEIRISEGLIEVDTFNRDIIDTEHGGFKTTTHRHTP